MTSAADANMLSVRCGRWASWTQALPRKRDCVEDISPTFLLSTPRARARTTPTNFVAIDNIRVYSCVVLVLVLVLVFSVGLLNVHVNASSK